MLMAEGDIDLSEDIIKQLIKEFEKKALTIHRFVNEGEVIIGKYLGEQQLTIQDTPRIYIVVEDLKGQKLAIRKSANLDRTFAFLKPDVGDYVMIRYEGIAEAATGRKFKKYTVAMMKPAEFNAIMESLLKKPKPQPSKLPIAPAKPEQPKQEQSSKQEQPQPQQQPPAEEAKPPTQPEEKKVDTALIDFITKILEFYGEMSYSDVLRRLSFRGYKNITIDDLKRMLGDRLEFNDEKKVIKKK